MSPASLRLSDQYKSLLLREHGRDTQHEIGSMGGDMGDWSQHSGNVIVVLWARLFVLRLPRVSFVQMALFMASQPVSEEALSPHAHFLICSCTLLHTHRHTLMHNPTQMHTLLATYPCTQLHWHTIMHRCMPT